MASVTVNLTYSIVGPGGWFDITYHRVAAGVVGLALGRRPQSNMLKAVEEWSEGAYS